jgi:hypothetical protein
LNRHRDERDEGRMSERNSSQDTSILVMLAAVFVPITLIHIIALMVGG